MAATGLAHTPGEPQEDPQVDPGRDRTTFSHTDCPGPTTAFNFGAITLTEWGEARLDVKRQGRGVRSGDTGVHDACRILVLVARNGIQVFGATGKNPNRACAAHSFAA